MPSVVVSVPGGERRRTAALVSIDGRRYDFARSPTDVSHEGLTATYAEVARPGREPLVIKSGETSQRITVRWLLGYPDPDQSVEEELRIIRAICQTDRLVRLDWGPAEQGWWYAVSLSATPPGSSSRTADGEISRAEMTLELRRALNPRTGAPTEDVRAVAA